MIIGLYVTGIIFCIASFMYWKVSGPLGELPTYEDLKALEEINKEADS